MLCVTSIPVYRCDVMQLMDKQQKRMLFVTGHIIIIIIFFNALGSEGSRGLKAKQKKMIKLLG